MNPLRRYDSRHIRGWARLGWEGLGCRRQFRNYARLDKDEKIVKRAKNIPCKLSLMCLEEN